ncbi:class II fructose-bisphosphate aldolase [Candidatus Saccharibacteria bacterium]|nr:class II fructose-bisphosphate aldolase [Candidatus Saccharibacteria bacterium]
MPLTMTQIRQNCADARAIFARARAEHFALGAFNLDNQETLIAVVRAAVAKKAPLLVEASQGEVDAMGLDNIRDMVDNYKDKYGLEIYINLDHSPTVQDAIAGIKAGFECIHIDISQAKHEATREEIITGTRAVVEAAKETGAMVEAEERYFLGSSNLHTENIDYDELKKYETKPEEAADFVARTGIDTFAAQVGNLHGLYPVPKVLDLELLQRIRQAINCNISLHGGSGTAGHYFIEAVKIGVSKININSDMRVAYRNTLEKVLAENKTEYAVVKLMPKVIEEVQNVVESKIDTFNSSGRLNPRLP